MSRIAWITGASAGLGRALSLALVKEGWRVAASARRTSELDRLAEEAGGTGAITPFPCDVTDQKAVHETIKAISARLGPIDLAVLNAGTHIKGRAADFKADDLQKLLDLNVMGAAYGLEALMPEMMARGAGRIALIASMAGWRGLPTAAAYGCTKAGLINMAEGLTPDLAAKGVTMQVVCPGFVRTPLTHQNDFPMPFLMEPEEAAQHIVKGLKTNQFEIAFPRRLAWPLRLLRALPAWAGLALTGRLAEKS